MSHPVADAYDANAELYASLFLGELDNDPQTLRVLAQFAARARVLDGPVIDVGCGPGSAVDHLVGLGLAAYGIDISPGQIEQARRAFPSHRFEVGDLTALGDADGMLGGLVSRYSVIHLHPSELAATFAEWRRVLPSGAPLFLSFFGARSIADHGEPFDHKVATAYALWPESVVELLLTAGFAGPETTATPIPEGGRPFDHVTLLAQAAGG